MHPVHVETFRVIFHSRSRVEWKIAFWIVDFLEKDARLESGVLVHFGIALSDWMAIVGSSSKGSSRLRCAAEREKRACFLNVLVFSTAVVALTA